MNNNKLLKVLKTFKLGGIHPPEDKLSGERKIEEFPIPSQVSIPVSQVLGAPSVPVVQKGDKVKTGQLIAKGEAFISANVHSSVSGTVLKIDEVLEGSGYKKLSCVINVDGDEWDEGIDRSADIKKEITHTPEEIIEKIKNAGLVGLGGATFPTYVKMMVPKGKTADLLIINGVECEPYLTADHRLMLERGEEILLGAKVMMKALGVDKAIVGIENNKKDAIEHMTQLCKDFENISVQPLKVQYPQGGEKQLIKAITGREIPSGKLPIEVGCIVQNVGTVFAAYEAVQKNKPLISRVVTITGKSIKNPSNFEVRIGTPVSELIEKAGGLPGDTGKMISGGPMMGKALNSPDVPVVKSTSGILIMTGKEAHRGKTLNCIRCGKCISVCPMGLEPLLIAQAANIQDYDMVEKEKVMDCIECGSCMYTCPSYRPLLDYIRLGKTHVGNNIRSRQKK